MGIMIDRSQYLATIRERLKRFPVVSVLEPRQVGKESYVMNNQTEAVAITNLRARLAETGIGGEP